MLKAICAGFKETTEPSVCLSAGRLCVYISERSFVSLFNIGSMSFWQFSKLMSALKEMVVVGRIDKLT